MYRSNTILFILLLILALLLLLTPLPVPRPILLPIPVPIPSSHSISSLNKKNFLTKNISFGISNGYLNANLGALVSSGALSHKKLNAIDNNLLYSYLAESFFENCISSGEWTLRSSCNEEALIGNV